MIAFLITEYRGRHLNEGGNKVVMSNKSAVSNGMDIISKREIYFGK